MDIDNLKQKLEEEKVQLEHDLEGISKKNPANPADWDAKMDEENTETADLNISADRHEELEERHGISDVLEARLKNVDDALEKMKNDVYGVCEEGGEKIEEDRLRANPSARTCKKHMK